MVDPDWRGYGLGSAAVGSSGPVVLLGRGGSGTRLLSQLALHAGVFLGNSLNKSLDSVEWVEDIYALAIESTTCAIESGSVRDAYWRDRLKRTARLILERGQRSPLQPWGWKLPETLLGLAQVLRTFPDARIVHLVRHPVTSALRRSHMTSRLNNPIGRVVVEKAYRECGRSLGKMEEAETYIHNAVTWAYQLRCATQALEGSRATLQLRYEELCASPTESFRRLARFLGCDDALEEPMLEIEPVRMNVPSLDDERVNAVWEICSEVARTLGYERRLSP